MMTKQDFEAIANSIAREAKIAPTPESFFAIRMVASSIAATCIAQNPRFDREKFMDACGVR